MADTLRAMYGDLREQLRALEEAGELATVRARVSPVLEISRIADVVSKSPAPHLPSRSAVRCDPRFHSQGGRALVFTNVEGAEMPVAINVMGSYRRMEMALGCHEAGRGLAAGPVAGGFEAIAERIAELVKPEFPRSIGEVLSKAQRLIPLLKIGPRRRRGLGECQEIVRTGDAIDLRTLPMLRCWPLDGDYAAVGYPEGVNRGIEGVDGGPEWEREYRGRYITLGGIHTIHASDLGNPKPGSHNIGMYRVQLLGQRTMAMHWHMHHDGARHWRSWKARGEPMPVAIALGGPSVLPYAATAPLPPGISELLMAGFLGSLSGRGGIEMVMGRTVPIWVPATAEIVIEGYVSHEAGFIGWDPRRDGPLGQGAVFEGPFGDHTGFYSMPDRYPIMTVTAVTHRRDPVYPTTIVGLPPQEDYYIGKATERIFLPLLKTLVPDIEDYDLPMFGAFHNSAMVKVEKAYPMQGRRVMHSIWGAGQMAWTKSIFVVDEGEDVHDTHGVLRAAGALCDPARDIEEVNGPLDILDHAAPNLGVGKKIGFDCTRKNSAERDGDAVSVRTAPTAEAAERLQGGVRAIEGVVAASIPESSGRYWLFVGIRKERPGQGIEIAERVVELALGEASPPPYIVVVDGSVDVANVDEVMFHWCANGDAGRDVVRRGGADGRSVFAMDATAKTPADARNGKKVREWPPILRMDPAVEARVGLRWREYGIPGTGGGDA